MLQTPILLGIWVLSKIEFWCIVYNDFLPCLFFQKQSFLNNLQPTLISFGDSEIYSVKFILNITLMDKKNVLFSVLQSLLHFKYYT